MRKTVNTGVARKSETLAEKRRVEMKKYKVIIVLILLLVFTGCSPVEQYTRLEPITGFVLLENGCVEFASVYNGRIQNTILTLDYIYTYEGESKIIRTQYERYNVYAYLSEDDFAKLQEQRNGIFSR